VFKFCSEKVFDPLSLVFKLYDFDNISFVIDSVVLLLVKVSFDIFDKIFGSFIWGFIGQFCSFCLLLISTYQIALSKIA
jgi:hypothetical protein